MSGWFAADRDDWELDLETRERPLKPHTVRIDLRHLENEVRLGGRFPTLRELMKRWGWASDKRVRLMLKSDWHDPDRPVDVETLQASRRAPFQRTQRGAQRGRSGERTKDAPDIEPIATLADTGTQDGRNTGRSEDAAKGDTRVLSLNHGNQEPELQIIPAPKAEVARRPPDLVPKLWDAIQAIYVGSGHGKAPLELDSAGRRQALERCLRKLHPADQMQAARMMCHLLAYWLQGPNAFWREHRLGSALVGTLLKPEKIGERYNEAESWVWDGQVHQARAGPGPPKGKESNFARQLRELQSEWEDEPSGIETGNLESAPASSGIRLLQQPPRR